MQSSFYSDLLQDLSTARKITNGVPLNACNTDLQELKLKSYILMSHAIVEQYLESIALDIAKKALKLLVEEGKFCRALIGLISSGLIGKIDEVGISKKLKREPFEDIELFATTAFGRFRTVVNNNHGIKNDDQLRIFLPIGVDPAVEDFPTMAALDGFGTKRGNIAHTFKINKAHTLSEILGDLETIKNGLIAYDTACLKCLSV